MDYQPDNMGQPTPPQPPSGQDNGSNKKGFAVASLVLGIVGTVFCCAWYISIACAVVGLILGIMSNKASKNGMATAGIVLSVIALVLSIVCLLGLAAFIAAYMSYGSPIN